MFAHVKAGQSEAALQAARDIVGIGLPLLEETYIALVYGLVEEGKVDLAEGVIMSMYNAGGTTRNGVLVTPCLQPYYSASSMPMSGYWS